MSTARRPFILASFCRRLFTGLIPAAAGLAIGGLLMITIDQGTMIFQQDSKLARQDALLSIQQHTIDSQEKMLRMLRDSEAHFTITPKR